MSTPVLTDQEINVLERLYTSAMMRTDSDLIRQARVVINDLKSGRALERVLVPMLDDLEREAQSTKNLTDDLRPGVARETARGRVTGIEFARIRIMRDNVVTVS